jgi:hypothetical protein
MFYKRVFLFLFLLITISNIYIFLNRDDYRFVKQSSYAELYPNYLTSIKSYKKINDSTLEVVINKTNFKLSDKVVQVKLKKGIHDYDVFEKTSADSLKITVEYLATEDYAKYGNSLQGGITIYNSPLLHDLKNTELSKWKANEEISSTPLERNLVNTILEDSIKVISTEPTIEKIKKISTFLAYKLRNAVGLPTDSLLSLSPYNQYFCGSKGQKIWCGNYAQIFMLFCKQANIKTRYVEINKLYNNLPGNLHIFNEYYITEQGKWAAIDLLNNNLFYKNNFGEFLNAVQIKNANAGDTSIKVFKANSDTSLVQISFSYLPKAFFDTYNSTKDLKYYLSLDYNEGNSLFKKFKRYFTNKYYYEFYSDNEIVNNKKFYTKSLFLWLQSIFTLIFIIGFAAKLMLPKK